MKIFSQKTNRSNTSSYYRKIKKNSFVTQVEKGLKWGIKKNHSDRFRHIHTYFGVFIHVQELFRNIHNTTKHLQSSVLQKLLQLLLFP